MRQFTAGPKTPEEILLWGEKIPFGAGLLFQASCMEELVVAAEICEDVWSPVSPGACAAMEKCNCDRQLFLQVMRRLEKTDTDET